MFWSKADFNNSGFFHFQRGTSFHQQFPTAMGEKMPLLQRAIGQQENWR